VIASRAIDDIIWHFAETGETARGTLVFLHGFTGSGDVWQEILTGLKTDFRCIVPDLPGHGRTLAPGDVTNYRLRNVADSLAKLLSAIGAEETLLWGYSMGGRLALQFATAFPQRLNRLVLESASPGIADADERWQRRQSDDQMADEIEALGVEAFIIKWESQPIFQSQLRLPAAKQDRMHDLRMTSTAAGLALSLRGMGSGAQEPLHDRLASMRVPTLILAGEGDNKFRTIGLDMARAMPAATYRVVPNAGHTTFWEQPEACLEIVRPFLLGDEPPDLLSEGRKCDHPAGPLENRGTGARPLSSAESRSEEDY